MVEFALVSPLAFLILLGIPILAVLTMGQIELNNSVRDSVRAAAICGSSSTQTLPDGSTCGTVNTTNYIDKQFQSLQGSSATAVILHIYVWDSNHDSPPGTDPTTCGQGDTLEIDASYQQPLYVPLVGHLIGNGSTNTRSLTETAEATCEQ